MIVKASIAKVIGKGKFRPWGSQNPECNYVVGMTTHANPRGDATTWVV